ncbi:hypothetical protein [Nocardia sp. NPDC024068]|uniref:hypothetical protein n=1 Tax=Nocardia sp. NPDC024068 TaxID=3157197 RepID=UPI0033DF145F
MTTSSVRTGSRLMIAAVGVAVLAGCGSGGPVDTVAEPAGTSTAAAAEPTGAATSTTAVPEDCPAPEVWDVGAPGFEDLKTAVTTADLPAGACVTVVSPVESHGRPDDWLAFYIGVSAPAAAQPDDLRPVATHIARLWKESELGRRTDELRIVNSYPVGYNEYLRDLDFRNYPWNGTPSRAADLARWTVTSIG